MSAVSPRPSSRTAELVPDGPGLVDRETLELAAAVVRTATALGRTLATTESLTGGLLGASITTVPGASVVYRGGLITYATDLKHTLGGVDADTLRSEGAVSAATAEALAIGATRTCGADLGLALTGVAGPTEQEGHPAGTVWLGWYAGSPGHRLLRLAGDRAAIRAGAVRGALEVALECLRGRE